MSNKNYCFENREAQIKSTNNKPYPRQNSKLVYIKEKSNIEDNKNNATKPNLNRNNPNIYAKEIYSFFINSFEETHNCSSFSPINKKPNQNTIESKPNDSNVNQKQGLKLSNVKEIDGNVNTIKNLNNSKGEDTNFNNEGKNDVLVNRILDNLPNNNKLSIGSHLISNKIKPKNNNLSLNLINKNNFFKKLNNNLSLNSNIIKTTTNKNSYMKSQFAMNSMNPTNPTILKSSFIMACIEKKNKVDSNDKDIELQKILNQDNEEKNKLIDNFNSNFVKSKNDINKNSKNRLAKSSISNFEDDKTQKINLRSKSKNNSIYHLTNSQNECLSKMAKTNKNRSISFNNYKYQSNASNNYNSTLKRYNSQNVKGIISNKAGPIVSSYVNSIEKKNSLDLLNNKYMRMLNESKSKSITNINKKYNEVYKYKKLPTSLTMKNLKTITDKRPVNGTFNRNQEKIDLEENLIRTIENANKIMKPIAKNNSYINKDFNSISNFNEMNISDIHNPNINEKYNFTKNLELNKKNNENNCAEVKTELNNNSKDKKGSKIEHNALKNSNVGDLNKSRSKGKNARNSISKENWLLKDFSTNNALFKNKDEIKKPIKNYEVKSKFKNRIFNEQKFKDLYNPKLKNQAKINNNNQYIEAISDAENMKKLGDNLKYLAELEDKLNKRLKTKNKSFASSNLNWNNLFVTGKSHNNFIAKNNKIQRNKSDNKTHAGYIDDLINKKNNDITAKQSNFNSVENDKDNKNFEKKLTFNPNVNKTFNENPFKNLDKGEIVEIKENNDNEANKNNKSSINRDLVNQAISSARIKENATISALKNEEVKKYYNPNQPFESNCGAEKQLKHLKFKLDKKTIEDNSITNSLIIKTATERILSERNKIVKSSFDTKNIMKNVQNDIKIFEHDSDIKLMDLSNYYKLDTDKDLIFNNINATESDVEVEEIKFESGLSRNDFNNKTKSNLTKHEKSNNNNDRSSYSNFIKNINKNDFQDQKENENLISNLVLQSKDSLNNNFLIDTEDSFCSKYADDVEDMNTLIKKLDFTSVNKNVENVFGLGSKIHNEFNIKFKTEIEGHLFPQRNQINSVRKRNDSNSKSVSTQDTSSKKTISPHNYKSLKGIIMESGREKINLYNVHLSKI